MRKADQALLSARQLLDAGDVDGACNRAYYAMYDAAHAALRAVNVDDSASTTKTHRGLIAAFGQYLVLAGHVPVEMGSALNQVERLRLLADYTGDPVAMRAEIARFSPDDVEGYDRYMKASEEIFRVYIGHYASEKRLRRKPTFSDIVRIWNGGPDGHKKAVTWRHWQKVQAELSKGNR